MLLGSYYSKWIFCFSFWSDVILTTCYLVNHFSSSVLDGKSACFMLFFLVTHEPMFSLPLHIYGSALILLNLFFKIILTRKKGYKYLYNVSLLILLSLFLTCFTIISHTPQLTLMNLFFFLALLSPHAYYAKSSPLSPSGRLDQKSCPNL